jgi:hypothetical protein
MNYELEKDSLQYFKNVLVLKSNNYLNRSRIPCLINEV